MRSFLLIICFLLAGLCGFTQKQIPRDSSVVDVRSFSAAAIQKYRADKEFQYERSAVPPQSLWDRFWEWFWDKVGSIFSTKAGSRTFRTIFIIVSIAILVFFIYKLTGMSKTGLFGRKGASGLDYSASDENIHTINFEDAIQQAIDNGNYRLAVRLLYLQSLKALSDRGLINWQINKTNVAYVDELSGTAYHQSFDKLTLQFENNWYGDVPITAAEFAPVREQFNRFKNQLS
jgi:hypothetical protein